jgi:HD-GYP domain-containing protein (c-di-GMP phosphodiesterase class II)
MNLWLNKMTMENIISKKHPGVKKAYKFENLKTIRKELKKKLNDNCKVTHKKIYEAANILLKFIKVNDTYTVIHQKNTAKLARFIAKKMNLSEKQVVEIHIAALVHDIGKMSVPAEILSKQEPLTPEEFNIIKRHSQVGHDVLKNIFPWSIAKIVLQHHERINGSGYPLGLKGENILLEAKILSVADVVDAMTFKRPYREALGIDVALEEISENIGVLYDHNVINACLKLFNKTGFIIC